jgi:hypothetical protein
MEDMVRETFHQKVIQRSVLSSHVGLQRTAQHLDNRLKWRNETKNTLLSCESLRTYKLSHETDTSICQVKLKRDGMRHLQDC